MPAAAPGQQALAVEVIKQHAGPQQVRRAVKVNVPGKHFPGLQPAEQKVDYEGTAVDYAERHKFSQHAKAWGAAQTGPGIRFTCVSKLQLQLRLQLARMQRAPQRAAAAAAVADADL